STRRYQADHIGNDIDNRAHNDTVNDMGGAMAQNKTPSRKQEGASTRTSGGATRVLYGTDPRGELARGTRYLKPGQSVLIYKTQLTSMNTHYHQSGSFIA
ncbi:MAG: hypothetical protein WBD37_12425, partial [Anderseniella sp.]